MSDTSQQIPTTGPPVTWALFKTVAVPSSRAAGPGITEGQVVRCFARTPTGALIAAWQILTRIALSDQWRTVADRQLTPGPGRDLLVAERAKFTGDTDKPGLMGQLAAFKYVTYTPDTAVVQLATQIFDDHYRILTITMTWSNNTPSGGPGDWRLKVHPDGQMTSTSQDVSDPTGFTPWRGV